MANWTLDKRPWQRIFVGSAVDVDVDGAGRVLISPELRRAASLVKDVMLIGLGTHLELWDAPSLERHEAAAIVKGMPESLALVSL